MDEYTLSTILKIRDEFSSQFDSAINNIIQKMGEMEKTTEKSVGGIRQSWQLMATGINQAISAYDQVMAKIRQVGAVVSEGAKDLRIDRQFEAATRIIGENADEFMKKMDEISGKTIEASKLKSTATIDLARGMSKEAVLNVESASIAMARVTGRAADEIFQEMSQGILRGYPRTLVAMGIITRQEMATLTQAVQRGIMTTDELANVANQRASAYLAKIGGAADDEAKKVAQLSKQWEDFIKILEKAAASAVGPILGPLTRALDYLLTTTDKAIAKHQELYDKAKAAKDLKLFGGPIREQSYPSAEQVQAAALSSMADETMDKIAAKLKAEGEERFKRENAIKILEDQQKEAEEKISLEVARLNTLKASGLNVDIALNDEEKKKITTGQEYNSKIITARIALEKFLLSIAEESKKQEAQAKAEQAILMLNQKNAIDKRIAAEKVLGVTEKLNTESAKINFTMLKDAAILQVSVTSDRITKIDQERSALQKNQQESKTYYLDTLEAEANLAILKNQANNLSLVAIQQERQRKAIDDQIQDVNLKIIKDLETGEGYISHAGELLYIQLKGYMSNKEALEAVLKIQREISVEQLRQQTIQERVSFYGEFKKQTGEVMPGYISALSDQLNEQAKKWKNLGFSDEQIKKMVNVLGLENQITTGTATMEDSMTAGFNRFAASVDNFNQALVKITDQTLNDFVEKSTEAWVAWTTGSKTGRQAFRDFATGFLTDLERMIVREYVALALKNAIQGLSSGAGFFGMFGGGQTAASVGTSGIYEGVGGGTIVGAGVMVHGGGYIRRYHQGGLGSDEVPAVLQRGEFVVRKEAVNSRTLPVLRGINKMHDGSPSEGPPVGNQEVHIHINAVDAPSFVNLLAKNRDALSPLMADLWTRNKGIRKTMMNG